MSQLTGTNEPTDHRPPTAAVLGGVVLAARPQVLILAPAYLVLLAGNAGYAWRRDERALLNDLASVLQSCLMIFVTALVADVPIRSVAPVFLAVLLYFTGTVPHVKAMIRERGNPAYRRASVAYHVVSLAVAAWLVAATRLGVPVVAVFVLLFVRAVVLPRLLPKHRISPKQVGIVEIVASGLLLAAVVAA